jgi:hypothetical protein
MQLKKTFGLKRRGPPGTRFPVLAEVGMTGPQWCQTAVIRIMLNEQMQKKKKKNVSKPSVISLQWATIGID